MELRITSLFNPLARAAGFFFSELGVSPTTVALSSFVSAILALIFFVFPFNFSLLKAQTVLTLAVGLIFVNAFLCDVERRVEVRRKRKSIFGGPLGTFLGQLSDIFIIFGALMFLVLRDTYYNFGRFYFLDFSYVEPGHIGHLALGVIAFFGIFLLRHLAANKKEKGVGLWTRSERMYLLGVFAALGIFSGLFSGLLFTGILTLTLLTYVSVVKRIFPARPSTRWEGRSYRKRRLVSRGFSSILNLTTASLKGVLRVLGVVLIGIYLIIEKLFIWPSKLRARMKKVNLPKRAARDQTSVVHPPIKPFGGTIAPSASSLPASTQEGKDESTAEDGTIELPPPEHLMEGDYSYTGGEDMGESMLVEYEPSSKKETVLIEMADFMMSEGKDVIVVSSQPATTNYKERFRGIPGIRVIDLPDRANVPDAEAIPITNLEYFSEVFENLGKRHVLIFEPLTHLILQIGVSQAYRFVSQTLNQLSKLGATVIVFINKEGHDKQDLSNFENLFMNIADIENGKLKKVK